MAEKLKPCPLCGSTNVTCFAEYDGDNWENVPVYHAEVACLGCHEEGCDPDYDEEPCFGIEAYYTQDHPLIRDLEDPEDCERALERHMAERWNRRAERTCRAVMPPYEPGVEEIPVCSECGHQIFAEDNYCSNCGAEVVDE